MNVYRSVRNLWQAALAIASATVILSSSCSINSLRAAAVGLESASRELDRDDHDDDITFGEWLLSELDD